MEVEKNIRYIIDNLLELLDAVDPVHEDWIEAVSMAISIVILHGGDPYK